MTSSVPESMPCNAPPCRTNFVCHVSGKCRAGESSPEPGLPLDFTQALPRKEKPSVYDAARALRAAGHVVYRQGKEHSVDGKITSDRHLVALASMIERQVPA